MNLILLFEEDFVSGQERVRLTGRRHRHILEIHRAATGDELCVGLAGGQIGRGVITLLDDNAVEMEIKLETDPPPELPLTLVLALPRPPVLRRALIAVTSMGVKKIILLHANRVEKSFWNAKVMAEEELRNAAILGLEQAKDTLLPDIQLRDRFKPFVEDELTGISQGTTALMGHPMAKAACPRDIQTPVTLAVGPEGGFVPYETKKIESCGFTPIHFGQRILRVETVLPALLARLFPL
jgi:16S rRNA (uracil1498-N3)-methyltransferase